MKTDLIKLSKPASIDELVQDMEKHPDVYQHLKVFIRRESSIGIPDFGEEFLAVSPSGFGLYRIESVDYQNGSIIISLTDTSTKEVVTHSVDINNRQPSCLFIRWKDIWDLILDECLKCDVPDSDLLELIE